MKLQTTIHTYSLDLNKAEDRETYCKLSARLRRTKGRGHQMHCISDAKYNNVQPGPITLDTGKGNINLFDNQWGSDQGRVFDWYEAAFFVNGIENKMRKVGHYLEITTEMADLRDNTLVCGYTGAKYPISSGLKFNEAGFTSYGMKEENLHLLRLLPVSAKRDRKPLTPEEREELLPRYMAAQSVATAERNLKLIQEAEEDCKAKIWHAKAELKGMKWLMERGLDVNNVIYYSHKSTFGFGWREPYSEKAKSALLDIISEFPFDYEIK